MGLKHDLLHATYSMSQQFNIPATQTNAPMAQTDLSHLVISRTWHVMQAAGGNCEGTQWVQCGGSTCRYTQTEATAWMFVQLDRLRKGASICLAEPGQLGVVPFTLAPYIQCHCISEVFSFLFSSFFAYLDSCGCTDDMLTMPTSSFLALGRVRMSACGGGALIGPHRPMHKVTRSEW